MCVVCDMRRLARREMRRAKIFPLILAAIATLGVNADRAEAKPLTRHLSTLEQQRATTLQAEGATVVVSPTTRSWRDDETGETAQVDAVGITVTLPGQAPFALPYDEWRNEAYGEWVTILRLSKENAAPVAIVEGYSGGAHCCATFQMVALVDGKPKALTLPPIDGEPSASRPRDIDGDGVVDFLRQDDSFRYAFASGAGSWSPPAIWNLRSGEMVDVSAEPRFSRLWRDYAARTLKACRSDKYERNGACAAHAAAMARLGRAEDGIAAASRLAATESFFLPEGCKVDYVEDVCPAGQEITFAAFEPALRWFLRENGYAP